MLHLLATCQQVPSMVQVMHHLGLFYLWHQFNTIPLARVICR
jgi:hypothetical protein